MLSRPEPVADGLGVQSGLQPNECLVGAREPGPKVAFVQGDRFKSSFKLPVGPTCCLTVSEAQNAPCEGYEGAAIWVESRQGCQNLRDEVLAKIVCVCTGRPQGGESAGAKVQCPGDLGKKLFDLSGTNGRVRVVQGSLPVAGSGGRVPRQASARTKRAERS